MSYDLYVDRPSGDAATQVRLLVTKEKNKAVKEYLTLTHGEFNKKKEQLTPGKFNQLIADELKRLHSLGIQPAAAPQMDILLAGSWFLQFTFTLAKPWLSKDDDPFYVAESVNPVRKDKVFKVPMMSASSWKGLLRWTLMHTRLAQPVIASPEGAKQSPEAFATERFVQTLLFGDEQGEEPGQVKGFAKYVDSLFSEEARAEYERLLRQYYKVEQKDPLPHHSGRLHFYPTFFDGIDVEVINPHKRETKAGTHPIYLECVPADATGTFTLLYAPLDRIGKEEAETKQQALADLKLVAEGLQALFTLYGFGAKTSSGFGLAGDVVDNGRLALKLPGVTFPQDDAPQAQKPDDEYRKYLDESGQVKPAFESSGEGELLSNKEYKQTGTQQGGGTLSEFKSFRRWYGEHGAQWQTHLQTAQTEPMVPTYSFTRLSKLAEICPQITFNSAEVKE
jgi:CRISPR-associated protein Cmr2